MPLSITNKGRDTIGAILLIFNTMAAAIAIALLSIGISTKSKYSRDFDASISPSIHPTLSSAIATAVFMLVVHAIGAKLVFDAGTTRAQTRALCLALTNPWLVVLCFTFFPTVVLAVLTLIERFKTGRSTERDVRSAMNEYASDVKKKAFVDQLQITRRCCGIESYEDWYSIVWIADKFADDAWEYGKYGCRITALLGCFILRVLDGLTDSVPFSCCDPTSFGPCIHHRLTQPAKHRRKDISVYTGGCAHSLVQSLRRIFLFLSVGYAAAAILQVVIFVFSRYLFTSVASMRTNNDPRGIGAGHLCGSASASDRTQTPPELSANLRRNASTPSESSPTSTPTPTSSERPFLGRLRSGGPREDPVNLCVPSLRPVFPTNRDHRRSLSPLF